MSMHIVRLRAENVMRVTAVDITPSGPLVVIGGPNGAGKTTVLDIIAMGLGGRREIPPEPIRRGAESGWIELDLGDFLVTRTFTASGGSLRVTDKAGRGYNSPQAMLNELYEATTFDPLEFSRQGPAEQAVTLKALLGLDFSDLEQERAKVFADRTEANRRVRKMEAVLGSLRHHDDAPEDEIQTSTVLAELDRALDENAANEQARVRVANLDLRIENAEDRRDEIRSKIEGLKADLSLVMDGLVDLERNRAIARAAADGLDDIDTAPIRAKLSGLDAQNQKVRENKARAKRVVDLEVSTRDADRMTSRIHAIDAEKETAIGLAEFPVLGLGFGEVGVTLDGLPLEQAASSEQLRVSVAIGISLHPRLSVILIREGSLLDDENMGIIEEMAAEWGGHIWIERVGNDQFVTVLMEDGAVKEQEE